METPINEDSKGDSQNPKNQRVNPATDHQSAVSEETILKPSSKQTTIILGLSLLVIMSIIAILTKRYFQQTPSQSVRPIESKQQSKEKNWVLKRQTPTGHEVVLSLPEYFDQIASWNNLLIYGSGEYSKDLQIISLDFNSGEKTVIFDQATEGDLINERARGYITNLQVVDNTLFFPIGGYLTNGATFWMTLPPSGPPQAIPDAGSGTIDFFEDRYWFTSSEGDACWGMTHLALINMETKEITDIATSNSGCTDGEEYIGIDSRGRMIMALRKSIPSNDMVGFAVNYRNVYAIPLDHPSRSESIITEANMPEAITTVKYLKESDQLLLVGAQNYVFDFSTNQFSKTNLESPIDPPTYEMDYPVLNSNILELSLPPEYEFVLE